MKKIALLSLLALGLGLYSCDDYKEPNPPAQYNPQESVLKTEAVVVTDLLEGASYDLVALNNDGTDIKVANVKCDELPAGYEFGVEAYISANGFNSSAPVKASLVAAEEPNNWTVVVAPDAMQAAYYDGISKGPKAKKIEVRFQLTTINGGQVAYIGGPAYYYGAYPCTVVPFPSDLVIEDAYYLIGTIDDWSVAGAIKLNHSEADPYDDPVFSIKINVPADVAESGWWWKIIPQSTVDAGDWVDADYSQYGVAENGDTAVEGMLVPRLNGEDPGAGKFTGAGDYLFSINMEEGTYSFAPAFDFLYTPGNSNGWSQPASQLLSTNDFINYSGYAYLNGEFKFSSQPDWDGVNYGSAGTDGTLSTDATAGNLKSDGAGLFWCNVNIASLTYSLTQVETIGLIGDSTPGGWDASTALEPSADFLTWTGTVTLTDGEFKFRANNGWDINLGGAMEDLTQDGANIKSPGAGTYDVTLYLGTLPYGCTFVKK